MMSGRNGFRSISRHAELEVALVLAVTSITAFAWCGTTLGTTFSGGPPLIPHDLTNGVDASPTEPWLALPSSNSHGMARVFPPADRASHLVDLRTWNPNLLGSGPQYYTQEPAPMGIADFGTNYSGENDPYIANSFIANATIYGLVSAVWTRDIRTAHRLAQQIKAGSVWINAYNCFDSSSPFGGYKQSGFGREMGPHALESYTQVKSVWVALD